MKVAIMQPTYLPWCGYFNMIDQVDVFVLFDTVQFVKKSWHHRNRVRAKDDVVTLTVPTCSPHRQPLRDIRIADDRWRYKHWKTIEAAYHRAPHWDTVETSLVDIYAQPWQQLTDLTTTIIRRVSDILELGTAVVTETELGLDARPGKLEHIEDILLELNADEFLEPVAATFVPDEIAGATVLRHHYHPAEYSQGGQQWEPFLSVIDLIAWHGPGAMDVIRQGNVQPGGVASRVSAMRATWVITVRERGGVGSRRGSRPPVGTLPPSASLPAVRSSDV